MTYFDISFDEQAAKNPMKFPFVDYWNRGDRAGSKKQLFMEGLTTFSPTQVKI